ncbi:hypothetical protein H4R26_004739 [Coemansia thaxteri]|uniref:Uncharacterized protein n=1 Tax=Coemansia thaxteri TaxID=2663907 RepID=A0A9W8EDQ6_9FUNG|nr:hypothetical protein H4R26_004739 [Coemansia thaxteri]
MESKDIELSLPVESLEPVVSGSPVATAPIELAVSSDIASTDVNKEIDDASPAAEPSSPRSARSALGTNVAQAQAANAGVDASHDASHATSDMQHSANNAGSDQQDIGNDGTPASIVAECLEEINLSDVSEPEPVVPIQPTSTAAIHDTNGTLSGRVAAAVLLKEPIAGQEQGVLRAAQLSNESERTAFSPPARDLASPVSSGSGPNMRPEIVQVSDGEDELDREEEEHEEHQQRLFRAAERRRQQREQLAHGSVSSGDMEIMRSGLSNAREHETPSELLVLKGAYPEGLRGSLFLVGPGQFNINYNVQGELEQTTQSYSFGHLMDALPLLTKISFEPAGKSIVHRSRLIAKQLSSRIHTEHVVNTKVPGALYLSDTNQTFLNRIIPKQEFYATPEGECCGQSIELFMPLQGSNQTVVCTNHVGALQNISPVDLRPRAMVDYKDINSAFKGTLSCPHMQYDSNTREHFSVLQDVGFRSTTYSIVAVSESQPDGYVVASFVAQASVLHSFAITQDYIIVPVYPYSAPVGGVAYRWGDSLLETLTFDGSQPVLFHVISREYRRVHCVYRAPAFFGLHQINAVQETATDSVAIDLVAYEDDQVLRQLQLKVLRRPSANFSIPSGQVRSYQLGSITTEATKYVAGKGRGIAQLPAAHSLVLRSEPVELARVNPIMATKPYTFLYGLSHVERLRGLAAHLTSTTMYNCIVKLNTNDSSAPPVMWSRKHCYPSEPVFVPRSDGEDDGYILSVFFDSMRIASCLLVLDATTFEEVMIAQLPSPVPLSFGHAKFTI